MKRRTLLNGALRRRTFAHCNESASTSRGFRPDSERADIPAIRWPAMRSLLLAFALLAGLAAPADAASWRRPVPGPLARPFAYGPDPFRAGWHRGIDLSARAGAVVRAACAGRVATARPGLVTLRCGRWRVTHLPVATLAVRRGELVAAGRAIGTLGTAAGHAGLHLGVRRAGDRFGYVDPLPFFGTSRPGAPPVGPGRIRPPATVPRIGPAPAPRSAPAPRAGPEPAPRSAPAPRAGPEPAPRVAPARRAAPGAPRDAVLGPVRVLVPAGARGLAPWPAWAGLVLLLAGAAGGGVRIGVRRRRARVRAPVASAP
jgi:peptidase M23-like protein